MKKILATILSIALVFSITACATETVTTENATNKVVVGLITLHDDNSTYDKNFIDAFKAACDKAGVENYIKTNIPETNECYEAAADLVDRGCNLIFADSFGHEAFLLQAAKEFKDVQFCHATGTLAHTENVKNYHNAFASIYEGRYLAGVAGGMKLKELVDAGAEPKVGYVGAFTYAEVISGLTSWYLGVKSVVPEVTMDVQFTGSWYDEALEKEAANTLIGRGCVLLSQHADSMGAPTACETAGIPDVSYNGSLLSSCPKTFIVSSKIDWTPYFDYIIECVKDGNEIATDWTGTIENGSVVLTETNPNVIAEGTNEMLADIENKLTAGELHVFDTSTFTVDGKKLESYMADVDTDENYTPDTEVIKDGYFHESEFRSAPYFDLKIDGITFVNTAF